jgi:hypothetical protein
MVGVADPRLLDLPASGDPLLVLRARDRGRSGIAEALRHAASEARVETTGADWREVEAAAPNGLRSSPEALCRLALAEALARGAGEVETRDVLAAMDLSARLRGVDRRFGMPA